MDDRRLIGIQFWGPPPAASGSRATDPASGEGADETEPPKIITPGNALWAFGLAEEEVKRLRAENAGLRAALKKIAEGREVECDGHTEIEDMEDASGFAASTKPGASVSGIGLMKNANVERG